MVCSRECIVTLAAFVWLFSTVCFQMCPQIACLKGCKATLVAFVWLFSTVCLQMCPQMACLRGCIITLVAFVWLFSTVCFQMCPQMASIKGCIATLIAFVWLLIISLYDWNWFTSLVLLQIIITKILIHHHDKKGVFPQVKVVYNCIKIKMLKQTLMGIRYGEIESEFRFLYQHYPFSSILDNIFGQYNQKC